MWPLTAVLDPCPPALPQVLGSSRLGRATDLPPRGRSRAEWGKKSGPAGRRDRTPGAQKNLHLCRVGAFETPQFIGAPHARVLDPTTSGGLASAGQNIGSRGNSIGSSKDTPLSRTPQRFGRPFPASQRECTT